MKFNLESRNPSISFGWELEKHGQKIGSEVHVFQKSEKGLEGWWGVAWKGCFFQFFEARGFRVAEGDDGLTVFDFRRSVWEIHVFKMRMGAMGGPLILGTTKP